jgi:beta-lactamase class A
MRSPGFVWLVVLGLLLMLAPLAASAQPSPDVTHHHDAELQALLDEAVADFRGAVGIYVRHLPSGRYAAIQPDTLFPTASMIKVPILLKTFDLIEKDSLDYTAKVAVDSDSIDYQYSAYEFSAKMTPDEPVELNKLILLMLTLSENNASLWLQHRVGTGTAINAWLDAHGYDHTRVNSRTAGRQDAYARHGWGQTTPREMAKLLVMIREGRAVSRAASHEMYRALTRTFWDDEALSVLPPWVQSASKQGAVSQSRSEVALVNAPHGDYVVCVITDDQEDTRWTHDNEGYALIRTVSRRVWNHFEPDSDWAPAPGAATYH